MRYDLLEHPSASTLIARINEWLNNGWDLHGDTFTIVLRHPENEHSIYYCQALILRKTDDVCDDENKGWCMKNGFCMNQYEVKDGSKGCKKITS